MRAIPLKILLWRCLTWVIVKPWGLGNYHSLPSLVVLMSPVNAMRVIPKHWQRGKCTSFPFVHCQTRTSGDWAWYPVRVHKTEVCTPINNFPCQLFIQGWSSHLQRKLHTSRFSFVEKNIFITLNYNYLCIRSVSSVCNLNSQTYFFCWK